MLYYNMKWNMINGYKVANKKVLKHGNKNSKDRKI